MDAKSVFYASSSTICNTVHKAVPVLESKVEMNGQQFSNCMACNRKFCYFLFKTETEMNDVFYENFSNFDIY